MQYALVKQLMKEISYDEHQFYVAVPDGILLQPGDYALVTISGNIAISKVLRNVISSPIDDIDQGYLVICKIELSNFLQELKAKEVEFFEKGDQTQIHVGESDSEIGNIQHTVNLLTYNRIHNWCLIRDKVKEQDIRFYDNKIRGAIDYGCLEFKGEHTGTIESILERPDVKEGDLYLIKQAILPGEQACGEFVFVSVIKAAGYLKTEIVYMQDTIPFTTRTKIEKGVAALDDITITDVSSGLGIPLDYVISSSPYVNTSPYITSTFTGTVSPTYATSTSGVSLRW